MVSVHPVTILIEHKLDKSYEEDLISLESRSSIKTYQIKWKKIRENFHEFIRDSYNLDAITFVTE